VILARSSYGARPTESGWVFAVFKFVGTIAAWVAADYGLSELMADEKAAKKETGTKAGDLVTPGHRAYTASQITGLAARGKATLSGQYRALYAALIADTKKAIQDPALTMADAAAFRRALFNYTLKHGDCATYPSEIVECQIYKLNHPAKKGSKAQGPPKPGGKTNTKETTEPLPQFQTAPKTGPLVPVLALAAAGLVLWLVFK
jgi:hypothetical protein